MRECISTSNLKRCFSVILTATLIVSGFFIFSAGTALAAHTASVTVSPNPGYVDSDTGMSYVKGNTQSTYTFTVTNNGADAINKVIITYDTSFTGVGNIQCPSSNWSSYTVTNNVVCYCDSDLGCTDVISSGSNGNVKFDAISPTPDSDTTYNWTVKTKDTSGNYDTDGDDIVHTTVDVTPPTIQSITTKDTNGNGKVDTATIVFSEPVDDSTFSASDFTIGGQTADSINTGDTTADDSTFDVVLNSEHEVEGTEAKDVTYTQGSGADLVGNLLANVSSEDIAEIDGANPVLLSAKTTSVNTIDITFSEDLNGVTVTNADFNVDGYTLDSNNDAYEVSPGVIRLTVTNNFGTGETPKVNYIGEVKDLAGLSAPTAGPITPSDGIAPILDSAVLKTSTTVDLIFSENVNFYSDEDTTKGKITLKGLNPTEITITGNVATLTFAEGLGTAAITNDSEDLEIASEAFKDLAGNVLAQITDQDVSDKAKPEVKSATANPDPAKAGDITITIVFSENMDTTVSPTVQITGITGSPITVTPTSYAGDTWVGKFTLQDNNEETTATISVVGAQDLAGNVMTDATSAGTFKVDTKEPMGYSVSIDQSYINDENKNKMSFKFTEAEVGATYNYLISSSEGDTTVSGQGTINDANQQISGIDVSGLNDGTLTLTVYLTDSVGNQGADATATVVKDTVAPADYSVKIDQDYINNSNQNALSFTFSSAETGATYTYSIDDENSGTSAVTGSGTITSSDQQITDIDVGSLSDGTLTLTVYLTDEAGNKGSDVTDTVEKDTVAPTVTVDSLITSDNTPELTGTVDDGSATVQVTVGSYTYEATVLTTANKDGTYSWTTDVTDTLSDGTYDVSVTATDQAGNVGNDDTSNELIIDTTAPTLDSITPENNSFVSGTQTFIFDFNDPNLAYLEMDFAPEPYSQETKEQVTFLASSDMGLTSDELAVLNSIGVYPSYNSDSGWVISIDTTATLPGELVGQMFPWVTQAGQPIWPDGSFDFYIEVGDSAGNQWGDMNGIVDELKLYTYTFDNTAPQTTLTVDPSDPNGNNNWYKTQPTITLTCTDETSGCDKIYYKWDTDTDYTEVQLSDSVTQAETTAPEGTHTLSYYSKDKAGNSEATQTKQFKVDTQTPTVSNLTVSPTTVNEASVGTDTFTVTIDYSEAMDTGVAPAITFNPSVDTTLTNCGGAWSGSDTYNTYTYTCDVADANVEQSGVDVKVSGAKDLAGNEQADYTKEDAFDVDTVAPAGYSVSIDQDYINNSNQNVLSFTFSGAEIGASYNYTITDGTNSVEGSGTISTATDKISGINVSSLSDGTLTLTVYLTDAAENQGADTTDTVIKDTQAPTLTPVHIESNNSNPSLAKVGDTVTLTFTASESIQTPIVTIAGNSATVTQGTDQTQWTATYKMTESDSEGVVSFTINYKDIAGNDGEQVTITTDGSSVTFDRTEPTITFNPAQNAVGVDTNTSVIVVFTEEVQCNAKSSGWAGCITVKDEKGNLITGEINYEDGVSHTLTFDPSSRLILNRSYTVVLSDISDKVGNLLLGQSNPQFYWRFTTANVISYDISLSIKDGDGWNLISIPTVPLDTSIDKVLGDAASKINAVWTYDTATNQWYVYRPSSPETSNLETMTAGYGYWIDVNKGTKIKGFGRVLEGPVSPSSRVLTPGWNLIGYYQPSQENSTSTPDQAFASLEGYYTDLLGYDNENKHRVFKSKITVINPGDAFWILMQGQRRYGW